MTDQNPTAENSNPGPKVDGIPPAIITDSEGYGEAIPAPESTSLTKRVGEQALQAAASAAAEDEGLQSSTETPDSEAEAPDEDKITLPEPVDPAQRERIQRRIDARRAGEELRSDQIDIRLER